MARIVSQSVRKPFTPEYPDSWLFLMTDGTMWILNLTTGNYLQAPALPGSRVVSNINYRLEQAYACATDGTIWSGVVGAGFAWQQCAVTPP
jgi:hypothetical protein